VSGRYIKALTVWQPWASLIIIGAKPIEWRKWRLSQSMVGERFVNHAGSRPIRRDEVEGLLAMCLRERRQRDRGQPITHPTTLDVDKAIKLLDRIVAGDTLPIGAALGTGVFGEPRLASDLGFPVDSDRLEMQNWGWPISEIERWEEPIAIAGAQGLWRWPEPDPAWLLAEGEDRARDQAA